MSKEITNASDYMLFWSDMHCLEYLKTSESIYNSLIFCKSMQNEAW